MERFDLIIANGSIVDGTGFPRFVGDIGVRDGVIVRVGRLKGAPADRVIDATGLIVGPGFVDTHTHYDGQIFWDPTCSNAGENGITTVAMGNCGFGFAPCKPQDRDRAMLMMQTTEQIPAPQLRSGLPWDWETFPELVASMERTPKAVNAMMFMPLNPLMIYVMGIEAAKTRRPTAVEISRMQDLIVEAMDAGACGLSVSSMGTVNNHVDIDGSPMPTDVMNIDDLCKIVAVFRERGDGLIQVISQIGPVGDSEISIRLGEASGRPILHNVFSTSDYTPDLHRKSMAWLDKVLARGIQMYAATVVNRSWNEVDFWNSPGCSMDALAAHRELTVSQTLEAKQTLARSEDYRKRFRDTYDPVMFEATAGGLERYVVVTLGESALSGNRYIGRSLGDIAADEKKSVVDVYLDLALESRFDLVLKTPSISARDPNKTVELISHSHVLAGASDGGAHTKIWSGGCWTTDLMMWLVKENPLMTLEQMHYGLSYQPARVLGLRDRGALLEGMAADILVYSLDELFFDRSVYEVVHDMPNNDWRRRARAGGYRWIVVNGEVTFSKDVRTNATPGRYLHIVQKGDSIPLAAE
ncbi:MAG TPA: amidohydrolase family protein [Rhizomicrobium sp.]|nr:amidohydrolase family protein [Rhizomicrobium sp.]